MENKFKIDKIDWKKAEQFGITKDLITNSGNMDKLLNGEKTTLLKNLRAEIGNVKISMDGKVRLVEDREGIVNFVFHGVKAKLDVPKEYLGYRLTDEDKKELTERNTLSKKITLVDVISKKPFDAYLGVDPDTKEVIALRASRINIPETLKGAVLTQEQKTSLGDGKPTKITGMTGENDTLFSAIVQVDVARKGFSFKADPDNPELKSARKENQKPETPKPPAEESAEGKKSKRVKL